MFYGEYEHSLDDKSRIIIPAKFRDVLKEGFVERFVITRGLDDCLFIFSIEEWKNLEMKVKTLPLSKEGARAFVRHLFSGAHECILDKQGRITIPANLINHAKLKREIMVVGVLNRIEIWDREKWTKYFEKTGKKYEEIAEQLVDLGI